MSFAYRWLGVAGLEFTYDGYTLLIDPFFTRPGKMALILNRRVQADTQLIARHISRADAVLVTHPHYDHLLDVPEVLRRTGAPAFGTANTCALLALHGIPAGQIHVIQVGDRLELGPFYVEVIQTRHSSIPLARLFNGPLPARLRDGKVRLPLRLNDYRMDTSYGFRIHAGGQILQVGKHPTPADMLFISPYGSRKTLGALLNAVQPRIIVPIHWDDFIRPLSKPLVPMLITPAQGPRPFLQPLGRLDMAAYIRYVHSIYPPAQVQFPEIFQVYPVV